MWHWDGIQLAKLPRNGDAPSELALGWPIGNRPPVGNRPHRAAWTSSRRAKKRIWSSTKEQFSAVTEELDMSRVEYVEGQVKSPSPDEMKALRDWFARFDAEVWDRQIESDATNGKLRPLAERALRDHQSGRSLNK
jgi:hypothetical protein